jgi:hypothetical protein
VIQRTPVYNHNLLFYNCNRHFVYTLSVNYMSSFLLVVMSCCLVGRNQWSSLKMDTVCSSEELVSTYKCT